MTSGSRTVPVVAAAVLAVGLIGGGWCVGRGLEAARSSDRFVTVRGLSERIVDADLAIWPIVFSADGDDLQSMQAKIDQQAATVRAFLDARGFDPAEWSLSPTRVTAHTGYDERRRQPRYLGEATIALRTGRIADVQQAIQESAELVRNGVAMVRSYEHQTQFLFTDLESIKPAMIAEATRDARRAAQQFADDSGGTVGAIRRAQQGYFSINDRDAFSPEYKKVRVVTTIDYFLVGD